MRTPEIELLWWAGCPSTEAALAELRAAAREVGLEEPPVRLREVRTQEEAEAVGFRGSPTILIDGVDPLARDDEGGGCPLLTCRVYRRRDGRPAPTPDPADLREALAVAAARPSSERRRPARC